MENPQLILVTALNDNDKEFQIVININHITSITGLRLVDGEFQVASGHAVSVHMSSGLDLTLLSHHYQELNRYLKNNECYIYP